MNIIQLGNGTAAAMKQAGWANTIPTAYTGKWEFYCYTYNGSNDAKGLKFYRNGTDMGTASLIVNTSAGEIRNNLPMSIGNGSADLGKDDVAGAIMDEIIIYNRTITGAEVTTLWNSGAGTFYNGTKGGGGGSNPQINITFPTNNSNWSNVNLNVNYTRSADLGLKNCWYSNDTYLVNISLGTTCDNITGVAWTNAKHNVTIWANDTSGNYNYSRVSFTIDTSPPDVNITFPVNNSNYTGFTRVNYTRSDNVLLGSCWYSNDTYTVNTSLSGCGNFSVSWNQGGHNLTVWANDTFGNENNSRRKFYIDSTPPNITNLENLTYPRNFSVSHNFTAVDSGVGVGNWSINWTTTFNITTDGRLRNSSALTFGEYWINVTVNDTLGNKRSGIFSLTFGYLEFNATLNDGINFTFIPTNLTSKGVNATGQNGSRYAIKLHNNQNLTIDIYAKISFNNSNITLKLGNSSNYSRSYTINTTYQKIFDDLAKDAINGTWAWADYNWSLRPYFPELEIRCAWNFILPLLFSLPLIFGGLKYG